ncbi:class I tRNA ligase family protein [Ralstonia solanacearum]|uniref:class I tRNA ligase family protein n=1 Tax=Ralstonia solanacearum TaxID=305 RepID=UPI0001D95D0A|nr:class I tRNA ligase family protein [Ralstonia solanacearum]CBJ35054.1 putative Valyl-tRNA synthetase [Ralstonia solanacearum PSI07]
MRWLESSRASDEPAQLRSPAAGPGRFVLLPPPNVTGDLHLGHGFSFTLLDTYVRYFRSQGEVVHFFPGTEHAGSRAEITYKRQHGGHWNMAEFVRWQQDTRQSILRQIACIGVDADWHAEYNSMDSTRVQFMRRAFVKLHGDGYIYPSTEMVNWCPCCRTSISEIDVKYRVQRVPRLLVSHADSEKAVTIATHGLERLLGATALWIAPEHPQFDQWIGREVHLLGCNLPIQEGARHPDLDSRYLTIGNPQVNPADFKPLGNAVPVNTYDRDGNVSGQYPAFRKDSLAASRLAVEQALARDGWTIAREDTDHQVAHCGVCSTELHPLVSEQWYFDIRKGLDRAGKPPQFHSALWQKGFELWLDKLRQPIVNRYHETLNTSHYGGYATNRDFQVSSQSLWGQPLPVWRCRGCGVTVVAEDHPAQCGHCAGVGFDASPDVISIFFSCCLMGPSANPSSEMRNAVDFTVCGHDIYHYWGSLKNILACALGYESGFGSLMVHGLLVDQHGEKMTKSKGNVIDIRAVIQRYGVDALRAAVYDAAHRDANKPYIKFDVQQLDLLKPRMAGLGRKLAQAVMADAAHDSPMTQAEVSAAEEQVDGLMQTFQIGAAYRVVMALADRPALAFSSSTVRQAFCRLLSPFHPSLAACQPPKHP